MVNENKKDQDTAHEPISHLLGSLQRVEAPNDFDFRLKARIAKGRPTEKTGSWLPSSVRFALPLALLVLVGGYFGLNSVFSGDGSPVPVVESVQAIEADRFVAASSDEVTVPAPREVASESVADGLSEPAGRVATRRTGKVIPTRNPEGVRSGGGSYDAAIKETVNLTSAGSSTNANSSGIPNAPVKSSELLARDFLISVGIYASFAGSGGRIQSVGGAAAAAGVKAGDVIESINVQGSAIRVRRDDKIISLSIK